MSFGTSPRGHRFAAAVADVNISRGHSRSRTSVYSYNEPNVIVHKHRRHVIYSENEPQVRLAKDGTIIMEPLMRPAARLTAIVAATSTAHKAAPRSASPRARASRALRGGRRHSHDKQIQLVKEPQRAGGGANKSKSSSLAQGSQGKRAGLNESSTPRKQQRRCKTSKQRVDFGQRSASLTCLREDSGIRTEQQAE